MKNSQRKPIKRKVSKPSQEAEEIRRNYLALGTGPGERGTVIDTLLSKFILKRYLEYVEPVRKGTPKGLAIGLSKKKYLASLLTLTNYSPKSLAIALNMPDAVSRNWKFEFKSSLSNIRAQHWTDFERAFFERLKERACLDREANDKFRGKPEKEIAAAPLPPVLDFHEFADFDRYDLHLQLLIIDRINKKIDGIKTSSSISVDFSLLGQLSGFLYTRPGIAENKIIKKEYEEGRKDALNWIVKQIKVALLNTDSEKDRKRALVALRLLEREVEVGKF